MEDRVLTRREGGFTLVEVTISIVLLAIVLVGFQAAMTQRLSGDLQLQDTKNAALQLAADRLRQIQLDPVYPQLAARYVAVETAVPGYTSFRRETLATRTVAGGNDYTTFTVLVTSPKLRTPVTRTLVIAAP